MAHQRIAINCGGYVPGLNGVVIGAALAARELGWEVVCVHDGDVADFIPETIRNRGTMSETDVK